MAGNIVLKHTGESSKSSPTRLRETLPTLYSTRVVKNTF